MKLASFAVETPVGPVRRVGVLDGETYVDVTAAHGRALAEEGVAAAADLARAEAPPDVLAFLRRGDRAMGAARAALDAPEGFETTGPGGARLRYQPEEIDLLAPVPRPNSLRDCMAFEEHVRNTLGDDVPDVWYELPVYYKGNPDSVVAPGADVTWPSDTDQLDYELEIAAVIGKEGRDVDADEAEEYIAGYTVFNDFSARDVQLREMGANLGPAKGKDFANGLGPHLVTPDELSLADATMTATVDGETWSEGELGSMHHGFPEIVEHVSRDETLYPGDVIGSGTVGGGCGLEVGRFLEPGNRVALTVEGLGTLEHRVVERTG